MKYFSLGLALLVLIFFSPCSRAEPPQSVVLVADYPMEPDPSDPHKVAEQGPLKLHGIITGGDITFVPGHDGQSLHFSGQNPKVVVKSPGLINKLSTALTITAWVKLDSLPAKGRWAAIITRRTATEDNPFYFGIDDQGRLVWQNSDGERLHNLTAQAPMPIGEWEHVAITFQAGAEAVLWLNDQPVGRLPVEKPLIFLPNPLVFGWDSDGRAYLNGTLDDVRIYATALNGNQIAADMKGTIEGTRSPIASDFARPHYRVQMSLARFDQPMSFRSWDGRRYSTAVRVPGPDAVDWPVLMLNDKTPLFEKAAMQPVDVDLLSMGDAKDLFRNPKDNVISPINHWFHANQWLFNRNIVYTTDRTARCSDTEYELWAFPVEVRGEGASDLQSVTLQLAGKTIYEHTEPLHSLTLLLPANLGGQPYELTVNGRGPLKFDVGLKPVVMGHTRDIAIPVDLKVPGNGSAITVISTVSKGAFVSQKEWDADLQALGTATLPSAFPVDLGKGFARYLGLTVPRSPIEIFTTSMKAGMSGGHFFNKDHIAGFVGTPEDYAAHLQDNGYDFAIDDPLPNVLDKTTDFDEWVAAMARHGLRAGANPDIPGTTGTTGNPNLAFLSSFLPEWGAPDYRDVQLIAQRFGKYPSFLGFLIGADNAGYVTYWDWAPTMHDRPWGRAYLLFQQGHDPKIPLGPELAPTTSFERRGTEREFVNYIHRYDETFLRYGYFAQAAREVNPNDILTTGSFGSAPGGLARGGWPTSTIPARPIFENLSVQTAYDWNELFSSKPVHNIALLDRLKSEFPDKPTWALIDDFALHLGREARQRAYALALTRGITAIGTTFLAHETGDQKYVSDALENFKETPRPRADVIREQKELYSWIHKYAGAYQGARPMATIGILFLHEQALSSPLQMAHNDKATQEQLLQGSQEGKTTEALFLCHAAGWPARIITPDELRRGLPKDMKVVLLVGLKQFDSTWVWYENLEGPLKQFVSKGGRLIQDQESVVPPSLTVTKTDMQVPAYVTQDMIDTSPLLFARNHDNVAKLRSAMEGIPKPISFSNDETIWVVPHQTGNVQYVTALNWGSVDGQNASLVMKPQTGTLIWNTDRPIYDVSSGKRLSTTEAQTVDLTKDAFRLYALPPSPVTVPRETSARGADGLYAVTVEVGARGVPVQIVVTKGEEKATLAGSSGRPIRLPIGPDDTGAFEVTATELLSGQTVTGTFTAETSTLPKVNPAKDALDRFAARRDVALIIALTPEQESDAGVLKQERRIAKFYTGKGRQVTTQRIAPGGLVTGLQSLAAIEHFPQWHTVDADLVLFGTPRNNILLFDQARGCLLRVGEQFQVTYSPFVGEYQVLNVFGKDSAEISAAVDSVIKSAAHVAGL